MVQSVTKTHPVRSESNTNCKVKLEGGLVVINLTNDHLDLNNVVLCSNTDSMSQYVSSSINGWDGYWDVYF